MTDAGATDVSKTRLPVRGPVERTHTRTTPDEKENR